MIAFIAWKIKLIITQMVNKWYDKIQLFLETFILKSKQILAVEKSTFYSATFLFYSIRLMVFLNKNCFYVSMYVFKF